MSEEMIRKLQQQADRERQVKAEQLAASRAWEKVEAEDSNVRNCGERGDGISNKEWAEQIATYVSAIKEVPETKKRFEELGPLDDDEAWTIALDIYRLCSAGEIEKAAALLTQCEGIGQSWARHGITSALKQRLPDAITHGPREHVVPQAALFHTLAFDLLGIDWLPSPRTNWHLKEGQDGYADPYFNDEDYQTLCNIVCSLVSGITIRDWRESTEGQRIALMRSAISARDQKRTGPTHGANRRLPCAIILTALQLEARAVLEHLGESSTEYDRVGTAYSCGTFSDGDIRWKVAVAECGPGNQRAGQIATHAIHQFDPAIVLFVGVAGTLKSDVLLGDVVASTKVYNYHSGKAEKDFLPRPAVENTSFRLEQLARAVARTGSWLQRIRRRHPDRPGDPTAHVGPIAAGEQVDADERSQTHKLIKQYYSDALAVEMEGYGTLAATNIPKLDAIIVRAISDNVVDKAQCDKKGWQPVAAHYASAFAFELLVNYQVGQGMLAQRGPSAPGVASGTGSTPTAPEKAGREDSSRPAGASSDAVGPSIHDRFEAASAPLLAWPTDLGRGEWMTRPELRLIHEMITRAPHSTTLLLGAPGSGKSALLARLGRELQENNVAVLAIKADTLGEEVRDAATLAAALGLPAPVGEFVRQLSASEKVVILLDQLDALAGLVDLRSGRLNALLNLVREVDELPNVHVVCSCREFEHRHDARLTAIEAEVVRLRRSLVERIILLPMQRRGKFRIHASGTLSRKTSKKSKRGRGNFTLRCRHWVAASVSQKATCIISGMGMCRIANTCVTTRYRWRCRWHRGFAVVPGPLNVTIYCANELFGFANHQ